MDFKQMTRDLQTIIKKIGILQKYKMYCENLTFSPEEIYLGSKDNNFNSIDANT